MESVTLKFRGRCQCWHRMISGPGAFVQSVQYSSPLIRSRSSPPSCPLSSCSHSYISSVGQAVKTSFPIISSRKSLGLSPPVTTVQHSYTVPLCKVREKVNANVNDNCRSRWLQKRALQVGFPASGSLSGYLRTLHFSPCSSFVYFPRSSLYSFSGFSVSH